MKDRLINIKLILRIIISVLIIFSCIKSCSKAYTWEEFLDYCEQTKNMGTYTTTNNIIKYIANNRSYVDTQVKRFINPNNYDSFVVCGAPVCTWQVMFFNVSSNYTISNNTLTWTTAPTCKCILQYTFSNEGRDYGNFTLDRVTEYASLRGLIAREPTNDNYGNYILQNKYVPPITFEFQPNGQQVNYENYIDKPWAVQNSYSNTSWNIGEFVDYAEYNYINIYLFDSYGNTIENNRYFINETNNQNSNLFINNDNLYIKSSLLNFGKIYTLALYCYDNEENMDSYTYNYIFLPLNSRIEGGIITDFGSGDFNIQDSTNTGISFWDNTIGKIFDESSGDNNEEIRKKVEDFYIEIGYSSGDVSGELLEALAGLDVINENYGDFKISWGSYNPNLTVNGESVENDGNMIPSGEINFSKFERENTIIQEVMRYVRAILSFSVFIMLGKNFWNTLMLTLGISPAVYDKATDEERTLNRNEENAKQKLKNKNRK